MKIITSFIQYRSLNIFQSFPLPVIMQLHSDFLKNLYLGNKQNIIKPNLQLLSFEVSQLNPNNEIIVRLSDGNAFIDSILSGPYKVVDGKIVIQDMNQINRIIKKFDIVQIQFFHKIDPWKICRLKLIIRGIQTVANCKQILGKPQQIAQYVQYTVKNFNPYQEIVNSKKVSLKTQNEVSQNYHSHPIISLENPNYPLLSHQPPLIDNIKNQSGMQSSTKKSRSNKKQNSPQHNFLTFSDIENGKQGIFIGRLVRIKTAQKQLKDGGIMTVLYLGFIDLSNNLVRISIAGNAARRERQNLIKNYVYTVKGIQNTSMDRVRFIYYLKLKDKQYSFNKINRQPFLSMLPRFWFYFDHQPSKYINIGQDNQTQIVDLVGIVQEIEEKIVYSNDREVIRISVRNVHKTMKVSFWADQIKALVNSNLKKYDQVILCDLKKKKGIYLDFTIESNVIKLTQELQLREIYEDLLPKLDTIKEPSNISQLEDYFKIDANKGKTKKITVYLMKIQERKAVYKTCGQCHRKVDWSSQKCLQCGCKDCVYKFNCELQLTDQSCSLKCVSFDSTTEKILNKTANQIHEMGQTETGKFMEKFFYERYEFGIQYKNDRYVVRSVELNNNFLEDTKRNLKQISSIRQGQKDYPWLFNQKIQQTISKSNKESDLKQNIYKSIDKQISYKSQTIKKEKLLKSERVKYERIQQQ